MPDQAATATPRTCRLVWDGTGEPAVPGAMGTPRADQLRGSPRDNLIELAGRVCYDSLGSKNARNTDLYHVHINETGHHSTHEHAAFTVELTCSVGTYHQLAAGLLNRPGLWVETRDADGEPFRWRPVPSDRTRVRLTLNPRTVRDWLRPLPTNVGPNPTADALGAELAGHAAALCPKACGDLADRAGDGATGLNSRVVPPASDGEVWASLYFGGVSRGLTHELVRHGDWTAISQRSTRFVAESESDWIPHPLIARDEKLLAKFRRFTGVGRRLYDRFAATLEAACKADPGAAGTARKQARGAARGLLGNALDTQLIFSASVRQWKHILRARGSADADAEIRLAAAAAFGVLRDAFPQRFSAWTATPCPDGIGYTLAGP